MSVQWLLGKQFLDLNAFSRLPCGETQQEKHCKHSRQYAYTYAWAHLCTSALQSSLRCQFWCHVPEYSPTKPNYKTQTWIKLALDAFSEFEASFQFDNLAIWGKHCKAKAAPACGDSEHLLKSGMKELPKQTFTGLTLLTSEFRPFTSIRKISQVHFILIMPLWNRGICAGLQRWPIWRAKRNQLSWEALICDSCDASIRCEAARTSWSKDEPFLPGSRAREHNIQWIQHWMKDLYFIGPWDVFFVQSKRFWTRSSDLPVPEYSWQICRLWAAHGQSPQRISFEALSNQLYKPTTLHTYILTYLHAYILTYLHTYIRTYLHTYMLTYLHTYLHTYILTYLHTYILTYLHTYILTYLHTYILTYIHTYIHTYTYRLYIYIYTN